MASVRSIPFVIDTRIDSSVGHRRSKLPSFVHRSKKFLDSGFPKVVGGDIVGFSLRCRRQARGQHWRIKRLAAMSDGSAEVEDGEESDDALKETIEKSKKVLAMQRDLIQQITERRKVVSSIKGSVIKEEDNVASDKLRGSSFSRLEIASSSDDDADEDFNTGSPSGSSFHSTVDEHMKVQPSAISKDFGDAAKKLEKDSPPPNTLLDTDSSKDNKSGTVISDERPSFLSKSSSASSQNDKKNKDMKKSSLQMDGGLSTGILSNSNIHSTADEVPETQLSAISKGSAKESEKDTVSPKTVLETGSDKQLKDSTSETVWSDGLPSFLSESSSTSGLKGEKQDESSLKMVDDEANIPISEDVKPPPLAGANVMNVILVAAECAPWSKTGGLGDVAGALPKALARRGHRVMVVAPRYGNYAEPQNTGVRKIYRIEGQDMEVTFFQAYIDGVDFVFIDSAIFRSIGNDIYGGKRVDILKRMVLFCKAAVEVPWQVPCGGVCYGDGNLVFIANDWHTALLPVYLKAYYRDNGLMKYTRSILVIHNIAHQGRGPVDDFSFVDLPQQYLDLFRLYDPVGGEHFNIFAAGLKTADRIVTVSHGYAWEVKTSEGGWGLHGIINEYDWKLKGIVNGIDAKEWNPQLDVHLKYDGYTNYSLETLHTGKAQCKAALQKELGLPIRDDVPLIGFIGRLDHQKGVDLIAEAVPWMMGQDVQLVMLGTGRTDLEQMLKQFESQHHDKIRGWVGFSVKTAHRITAGSDILLMPSRFEPCGLNQLYAMCYGTIPVVHAVGGLRDTVEPFNPYNESGLGWTFDRAEAGRLIHALGNCLLTYREYKKSWEGIQKRGMMQDLSWDNAAQNYEEVLVAAKYQW